jgi:hypothetical protein
MPRSRVNVNCPKRSPGDDRIFRLGQRDVMTFRREDIEALRLLRAFEKIRDRQRRLEIIKLAEDYASRQPPHSSPDTERAGR